MILDLLHSFIACLPAIAVTGCCAATAPSTVASPVIFVAPPPAPVVATLRPFAFNVTYEIAQYVCIEPVSAVNPDNKNLNKPRLIQLPEPGPGDGKLHGPSPVWSTPARFRRQVVGWIFAEAPVGDVQTVRWLLLHEMKMASEVDVLIQPAQYMGWPETAPITANGFTTRAGEIFRAAKLSSPDPQNDRTRYVKTVTKTADSSGPMSTFAPVVLEPYLPFPMPPGNGEWDGGGAGSQLDGGTVGYHLKLTEANGTVTTPLAGWAGEANSGANGNVKVFLKNGWSGPTPASPLLVGPELYTEEAQRVELGEVAGTGRRYNTVVESATYYQDNYPTDP